MKINEKFKYPQSEGATAMPVRGTPNYFFTLWAKSKRSGEKKLPGKFWMRLEGPAQLPAPSHFLSNFPARRY